MQHRINEAGVLVGLQPPQVKGDPRIILQIVAVTL
jgi:hypothetical protein